MLAGQEGLRRRWRRRYWPAYVYAPYMCTVYRQIAVSWMELVLNYLPVGIAKPFWNFFLLDNDLSLKL